MSLVRKPGSDLFHIEDLWLEEIVERLQFPSYRKVFTKCVSISLVILNGDSGNWKP
jgi:hypothetical protein